MKRRAFLKLAAGTAVAGIATRLGAKEDKVAAASVGCHVAKDGSRSRLGAAPQNCDRAIRFGGCMRCFRWTSDGIGEAIDTWFMWPGFEGSGCSCGRTANVLGGGTAWLCCCGRYNFTHSYGGAILHEAPSLGPSAVTMRRGTLKSKKYIEYMKEHYYGFGERHRGWRYEDRPEKFKDPVEA